jgi:translation initiation factor 2 subunit 2
MEKLYDTDFLLERLFKKLEGKVSKKKSKLERPIVSEINKKTYIKNFPAVCKSLNRDENHFKLFLEKELNIDSSINEDNILILDSKFRQAQVENAVEKYARNFVICLEPKCSSTDTKIVRENRILYLVCNSCNSRKSIDETY